jgi:hypothetical protein
VISSEEGLSILKNWNRARTVVLVGCSDTIDSLVAFDGIVDAVGGSEVVVSERNDPSKTFRLDIRHARFDKAESAEEMYEDFPMSEEDAYSFFLFVLKPNGESVFFAVPISVN